MLVFIQWQRGDESKHEKETFCLLTRKEIKAQLLSINGRFSSGEKNSALDNRLVGQRERN